MSIEVKRKRSDEVTVELIKKRRKIFIFKWDKIMPRKSRLISDQLIFHLDFKVKLKKTINNDKIILFGEFNDQFWFFRIIKDINDHTYELAVDKPLMEKIHSLKLYIIDWYSIIHKIEFNKMEIEYAVFKAGKNSS